MKNRISLILMLCFFTFVAFCAGDKKGELYSNASGTTYCCCPGGVKICDSPECDKKICEAEVDVDI
jgi:hypothetical protein